MKKTYRLNSKYEIQVEKHESGTSYFSLNYLSSDGWVSNCIGIGKRHYDPVGLTPDLHIIYGRVEKAINDLIKDGDSDEGK